MVLNDNSEAYFLHVRLSSVLARPSLVLDAGLFRLRTGSSKLGMGLNEIDHFIEIFCTLSLVTQPREFGELLIILLGTLRFLIYMISTSCLEFVLFSTQSLSRGSSKLVELRP
ncbi:hypothetical protein U1Q18_000930 [Sarracenia purpurea var. burkii]